MERLLSGGDGREDPSQQSLARSGAAKHVDWRLYSAVQRQLVAAQARRRRAHLLRPAGAAISRLQAAGRARAGGGTLRVHGGWPVLAIRGAEQPAPSAATPSSASASCSPAHSTSQTRPSGEEGEERLSGGSAQTSSQPRQRNSGNPATGPSSSLGRSSRPGRRRLCLWQTCYAIAGKTARVSRDA
ncbi:hypothetical protein PtA15_15A165 [Puccinia triticina]|uniref:Uncharacterized protein n=1 Tax=Puccinia triticina TaxID=208348 RepID=A0ABY7D3S6_9BASI|nr:uncharacterized protein PtA15_15A165 [Puccinia triticina]WAQ91773.1 hypothetical protein PtA15_15A165 [Puccinia triticina]